MMSLQNELSGIKGQAKELIANVNDLTEKILTNYKFQQEYKNTTDYIDLLNHIKTLYSKNGIQKELKESFKACNSKNTLRTSLMNLTLIILI